MTMDNHSMNTAAIPADLHVITGHKPPHIELLKASGVFTASDLADSVPVKLHRWMEEVNTEHRILRSMPSVETVAEWVACARSLAA